MDEAGDKGSIGNYKGVMLCNRPPDAGAQTKKEGNGTFISRVTHKEPLGVNPVTVKPGPIEKAPRRNLEILARHKKWLAELAKQKDTYAKVVNDEAEVAEKKMAKFKAKQERKRVKVVRNEDPAPNISPAKALIEKAVEIPAAAPESPKEVKQVKLTEKNLEKHSAASSKRPKPKWAMTEEQADKADEEADEAEVEDLLKFVYDLDYEAFMDDFQVRQAMEIVKERVAEIRADEEGWQKKIVEKYNRSEAGSQAGSQRSEMSIKSFESKARERVAREQERKSDWDNSSRVGDTHKINEEEKIAKLVADDVIQSYPQFKGVHSNKSVRKMLEREALKQLGETQGPKITIIQERERRIPGNDASNLPYLHRNPAV